MSLDNLANLQISIDSARLTVPGFDTPMILCPATEAPVGFTNRIEFFSSDDELLDFGFLSTDQTRIEARAIFQQNPRVSRVAVGRRLTAVQQVVNLALGGAAPDGTYEVTINGTTFSTAAVAQTPAQIVTTLVGLINGGSEPVTAVDNTGNMDLTADVAGIPFTSSTNAPVPTDWTKTTPTPNQGIPEDLNAIDDENPDWYLLLLTSRSDVEIETAAAAIETRRKLLLAQTSDADVLTAVTTDVASRLQALNYLRTAVCFYGTDATPYASSLAGRMLPEVPGSATWHLKTVVGVAAETFTTTQEVNLKSKNVNFYTNIAGRSVNQFGTVASGEFLDVVRGIDKLYVDIQTNVFLIKARAKKVPYTQAGIAQISAGVRQGLETSTSTGLIARTRTLSDGTIETPAYTVTDPLVQNIADVDKAARTIPASNPISFEATLAGAIHVTNIRGTVSV